MAIKFRRIEDRAESMIQTREREAVRRERTRLLPKLIALVVVVVAAVLVYGYFHPPKIVAAFVVHVDPTQVATPVDGLLVWLLPSDTSQVGKGQVLARIRMRPQAGGSAAARMVDMRLRAQEAEAEAATLRADLSALAADMAHRARSLDAEVSRLRGEVDRAEATAAESKRRLDRRIEDARTAEQLQRLDAITLHDLRTAREAVALARANLAEARSDVTALQTELAACAASREQFETTRRQSLLAATSRVEAAVNKHRLLRSVAVGNDGAVSEDGEEYVIRAPIGGQVLSIEATPQSRVEAGELLVQLYDEERVVARAFVPVRHRAELRPAAPARLYLRELSDPLEGQVDHIQARVTPLPPSLAERLDHDEASVVAVDIRCSQAGVRLMIPGQVGRAVIEK